MSFHAWIIGGAIALVLVLWLVLAYNKIIRLENAIDNAWGQIDVQLKRRAELIPNLISTVKGYAAHEKQVLDNVTRARSALMGAKSREQSMEAEGLLEQALGKLFAVAEAYPDLKANQNFLQLQDELTHTENKVSFARQYYNDSVLRYNNMVEQLPGNVIAGLIGREEKPMLETPAAQREVPNVEFGA